MADNPKELTQDDQIEEISPYTTGTEISRVTTSGEQNEFIHIGRMVVRREELVEACGWDLQPGIHVAPTHKFANASAVGLMSFSLTNLVLAFFNIHARHVTTPNMAISVCFFGSGLLQTITGMWEIVGENTFAAASMSAYGGFWLSYGAIFCPTFKIIESYSPEDLSNAIGCYMSGFTILTFIFVLCSLKSNVEMLGLFVCIFMDFFLAMIGLFMGSNTAIMKASGWFGIGVSIFGFYLGFQGVATPENSYIQLPEIPLPWAPRIKDL